MNTHHPIDLRACLKELEKVCEKHAIEFNFLDIDVMLDDVIAKAKEQINLTVLEPELSGEYADFVFESRRA